MRRARPRSSPLTPNLCALRAFLGGRPLPTSFDMTLIRTLCLGFGLIAAGLLPAAEVNLDLAGPDWAFALDPTDVGETKRYAEADPSWSGGSPHPLSGWDTVAVPHDYLTDPRYEYTGVAWYRRSFAVPADAADGRTWRLQFDSVFQRCRVWLNGLWVGKHEGGYTPFEFSVGEQLLPGRQNFLVVAVDNRVKFRALPGARSGTTANSGQYPWLNYGGILGGVRLVGHAPVWIAGQKIETSRTDAGWLVRVRVELRNDTAAPSRGEVRVQLPGIATPASARYDVAAKAAAAVIVSETVPVAAVQTWDLASPTTYESRVTLAASSGAASNASTHAATFGFRTIEIKHAEFQLNGRAIRWAGANRARGHPVHGGIDPDALVAQDLTLMKNAGLVFARIQHTAPGRNLLEWADRHGLLVVLEVGMWGYVSADQASPELRHQFQAEMRELIELARNHPSVVGWSLGNEYESWTPEGVAWTRDMAAFVRGLDGTRPVTFAALGTALRRIKEGEDRGEHAFDHVDYISPNLHFKPSEVPAFLDAVHARWPNKPVAITEFGLRADRVKQESERLAHFDEMLAIVAARPWICGLAYWSFNDYSSRYPGSGDDGYRRWGLVDEHRRPRALYRHVAPLLRNGLPGGAAR